MWKAQEVPDTVDGTLKYILYQNVYILNHFLKVRFFFKKMMMKELDLYLLIFTLVSACMF